MDYNAYKILLTQGHPNKSCGLLWEGSGGYLVLTMPKVYIIMLQYNSIELVRSLYLRDYLFIGVNKWMNQTEYT